MCNFHGASQIILRESLVKVFGYISTLEGQEAAETESTALVQEQRDWVDRLSAGIIRSFPTLLGFTHRHERGPRSLPQGKLAGRLFSLFPMWVVQRAEFASEQHKQTASDVTTWIMSRHGIG